MMDLTSTALIEKLLTLHDASFGETLLFSSFLPESFHTSSPLLLFLLLLSARPFPSDNLAPSFVSEDSFVPRLCRENCYLGADHGWGGLLRVHAIFNVEFCLPFRRNKLRVISFYFNSLLFVKQGDASSRFPLPIVCFCVRCAQYALLRRRFFSLLPSRCTCISVIEWSFTTEWTTAVRFLINDCA